MIDINFNVLCTIDISHEYYGASPWYDFTIMPSQQTLELLGNCRIIYRQQANQFIIGIQSVVIDASVLPPISAPFIMPPMDQPFTFFIQCNNPFFSNFTNIPLPGLRSKLFYFTNRNNNSLSSVYYLSNNVQLYNSTNDYTSGDMVNLSGVFYTAIQSISKTNPVDPPNVNCWREIDNNQMYASQNDLLQWLPAISNYPLSSSGLTSVTYQVTGYNYNPVNPDYSASVLRPTTINFPPSDTFKLDLSALQSGKYKLIITETLNGNSKIYTKMIYLNSELNGTATFCGIIELYNESTLPAGYSYLDNNNNLFPIGKMFSIFFLNRATIWKYILNADTQGTITMVGYNFPAIAGNPIYSSSHIPLSETQPTAQAVSLTGNRTNVQPNFAFSASVARASPQRLSYDQQYYCSEIYLNY